MTFKERIDAGIDNKFQGLSNGLSRINKYIFNVQRSCYTLIGGLSGSAKTKLIDFIILNALSDAQKKGISINVFYYSYEIDEMTKRAEWLAMLLYKKYNKIISPEKIKGLGDFRLDLEEQKQVEDTLPELELLFSKIMWRWETMNPTGIRKEWWDFMKPRGTFIKEPYLDEHGEKKERIIKFTPTDPNEYNIVICDHIALCKNERGFSLKQNLDKLSEYAIAARNLFGMSFFFLQQFNQGLNSIERAKYKGVDISPQQNDFKDTTNPYTDADICIGLMNAYKMDMETCLGYNINKNGAHNNLKDKFRMIKVVKNRLSRDNIAIGLKFIPEACYFEELDEDPTKVKIV